MSYRIGIDLGGTKTEILILAPDGAEIYRHRTPTPRLYAESVRNIVGLITEAEAQTGVTASIGIGIPGSISPRTGLVRNANSNALNGHPFDRDLAAQLGRPVRVANDANCFALSEAVDGAGAGSRVVFGLIIGTGCGAGIVVDGTLIEGRHLIGGEFGHTPLPWPKATELPLNKCWCGLTGCLETYISGTALAVTCDGPNARDATTIPARAAAGEARAIKALDIHANRLARALALVTNLLDPDAIVLGGGLSNMAHLYEQLPTLMRPHVFSDYFAPNIVRATYGDSSGVRGAAWLWPEQTP